MGFYIHPQRQIMKISGKLHESRDPYVKQNKADCERQIESFYLVWKLDCFLLFACYLDAMKTERERSWLLFICWDALSSNISSWRGKGPL